MSTTIQFTHHAHREREAKRAAAEAGRLQAANAETAALRGQLEAANNTIAVLQGQLEAAKYVRMLI